MALDFPSSPTNGQVYGNYYYNSARGAWNALLPAATPNFFTNAQLIDATVVSSVSSTTPLTVKGVSGQTANLQEWQDSTGTDIITFASNGAILTTGSMTVSGSGMSTQLTTNNLNFSRNTASYITNTTSGGYLIHNTTTTTSGDTTIWTSAAATGLRVNPSGNLGVAVTPFTVKASASQTADLQQWQSSTGAVLSEINSAGELQVPRIGVGSVMPTTTQLHVTASAATNIPVVARGAASQTANLQEWQNSSGTNLLSVTADGTVNSTIRIIATTPNDSGSTGGIAIKAPSGGSQPSGFLQFVNNAYNAQWASIEATSSNEMKLNASYVKIPYQPTFFAYQPESGTYQIASGKPIFTSTLVNIGSNYNTSNGRFTAPTAGVYQFSAQMLLRSGTSNGEATFFKNDANVISRNLSYSMPMGSNAHDPMHFTVFLSLAAGDFVDVRVSATVGDWYFGGGLGWFAGRLVG